VLWPARGLESAAARSGLYALWSFAGSFQRGDWARPGGVPRARWLLGRRTDPPTCPPRRTGPAAALDRPIRAGQASTLYYDILHAPAPLRLPIWLITRNTGRDYPESGTTVAAPSPGISLAHPAPPGCPAPRLGSDRPWFRHGGSVGQSVYPLERLLRRDEKNFSSAMPLYF